MTGEALSGLLVYEDARLWSDKLALGSQYGAN